MYIRIELCRIHVILFAKYYYTAEESSQEIFKRSNSNSSLSDDSGAHSDDAELDTYFRCPCGRTDFPHCLYPPPMCLDNRHSNTQGFPELDLSHGADNESRVQQRMDERLVAETTTIRNEYMRFGMAVRNWVQSINQIESILMTLVQLQGQPHANFSSFDELFRAVIVNADYINYEALKIVVEECRRQGSNDELYAVVQVAEEKFDQAFCKFARQRVFSLPGGRGTSSTHTTGSIQRAEVEDRGKLHHIYDGTIDVLQKGCKEGLASPRTDNTETYVCE